MKKLDICIKSEYTYSILNGNIASKNGTVYTYGDAVWKDLLTKVGDAVISYDAQGNPTAYLGHTLTWEKGRQLKSFDGNTYTYNANGIRTSKTVGGVKHTYALDGTKILCETWNGNALVPLYDNEDSVCGIVYNDEPFYFQKNLQGDVIGIMDKDAHSVAKYSYDAWGVCTVTSDTSDCAIATVNPYRYRGYYYDNEIGMYYLQSRYYNPVVGRFVNGDDVPQVSFSQSDILSTNLFTYCHNNPSNMCDEDGESAVLITLAIVACILRSIGGAYIGAAIAKKFGLTGWKKALCVAGCASFISIFPFFLPLLKLYSAIKSTLFIAGITFLTIKRYTCAAIAYTRGMWGFGEPFSSSEKAQIIKKIRKSKDYTDCKARFLRTGEVPNKRIEFKKDRDLYYAFQHMVIKFRYDKRIKKYVVSMDDTYDFDEMRKILTDAGVSFANAANNLGLFMQKCGMMIPYDVHFGIFTF